MQQYELRRIQHELRMKQLRSEIEQIEKEIEQIDRENARLENLLSCVDQRCFPPESSLIPPLPTDSDCGSSSR